LEYDSTFDLTSLKSLNELLLYANHSPPIANYLANKYNNALSEDHRILALYFASQEKWHSNFLCYLKDNLGHICVVGNAASLKKQLLGNKINRNRVVIRFNHYCLDAKKQNYCGKSIDVWVRSPDFELPLNFSQGRNKWMVISGADINFSLSNWSGIKKVLQSGISVMTPPLRVWKELVEILEAPPSAGILILWWLIEELGSVRSLSIVGFQLENSDSSQYHYSLPRHSAGIRHNWVKEREILMSWKESGLNVIDYD